MQAIQTSYKCPTNSSGARIVASADAGRMIVPYDHALDMAGNHRAAALEFANKHQWTRSGKLISGTLRSGDHCHVFTGT